MQRATCELLWLGTSCFLIYFTTSQLRVFSFLLSLFLYFSLFTRQHDQGSHHFAQLNMSGRGTKRSRRRFTSRSKRPIDKNIVAFSISLANATQGEVIIWPPGGGGAIFPGTITGIRWNVNVKSTTSATVRFAWAIVRVREGQNPSGLNIPGASGILYKPEQDVIVIGHEMTHIENNTTGVGWNNYKIEGTTKSMRKIQNGDRIYFICQDDDSSASANTVAGMIEYFIKT